MPRSLLTCPIHALTAALHSAACLCNTPQVGYREALAAVFIESLIFIFISLVGLRGRLIELVPKHIMLVRAGGVNGTRRTAEHVSCFAFGLALS
jgi:xanthine/uracil/vitamin C permease (AzgA family)